MQLLNNSGNATGAAVPLRANSRAESQLYTLYVWGTFDGGAVTLQISPHETGDAAEDWFTITGLSVTTQEAVNVEFRAARVRAVAAGGGAGIAVDAVLR